MTLICSIVNGELSSTLSVQDRGLSYGDGVFETIALVDQKIIFWDEHYQRLLKGCAQLRISHPSEATLKSNVTQLLESTEKSLNYVIKIIVTRGNGERGYKTSPNINSNIIISLSSYPNHPKEYWIDGIKVKSCETKLSSQRQLAGIKHLNRLEQVLARQEWVDEYQEGLLSDDNGYVIEGVMSNLFIIKDKIIYTPSLTNSGVEGIMRHVVLNLCESNGMIVTIEPLSLERTLEADEVFLTNSLIGIWPVSYINGQSFAIGNATKNIMQLLLKNKLVNYASLCL